MSDPHALAAVARDLYALTPAEFTAARDAAAKQARSDGDRDLARDIGALRRPTIAAWVVNLLVRRHPDQVEEVLAVGEALREAQAALAGDRLRTLGRERQQALATVVRQARANAHELGQAISDAVAQEVEETFSAALADPAAQAAVRDGLLTTGLSYAGLGEVDLTSAVALAPPPGGSRPAPARSAPARDGSAAGAGAPAPDDELHRARERHRDRARDEADERARAQAHARAEAETEAGAAAEAAAQAEAESARAAAAADDARARRDRAQQELLRAQARLREAEQEVAASGRDAREAARAAAAAARAGELARAAVTAARARLDALPPAP